MFILCHHETFHPKCGVLMHGLLVNEKGTKDLLYFFEDPSRPRTTALLASIDEFVAVSVIGTTGLHPVSEGDGNLIRFLSRVCTGSNTADIQIHKPATDEFLKILRTLWGDKNMSFNEWVARIAGSNRGILRSSEIERLLKLQNFDPAPNQVGASTDIRYLGD